MNRIVTWLAAAALTCACTSSREPLLQTRLFAMGTWVDLTVVPSAANADAALREIETLLRSFERDYYAWADGELARINAALAAGEAVDTDARMAALLERSRAIAAASGHVFEPAVGALVELWGFHSDAGEVTEPPSADAIAAWIEAGPSIAAVAIDGRRVSGGGVGVKLDLGGIAKGYAVDLILEILRRHGVDNALVNAGGDLGVLGSRRGAAWRIGIRSPRSPDVLGVIELADGESAFTSGDYERYYERSGRRLHHILDSTTGYPAEHTQAITVLASDPTLADAAATALFVAGPDRWREVAQALGIAAVLRVDASGEIQMTDAMRDRLQVGARGSSDIMPRI
jgi:thiamine biosynthesis lipoprotein